MYLVYRDKEASFKSNKAFFLWGAIKYTMKKIGSKGYLPFLNLSFKSRDQTLTLGKGMGG